MRAQSTFDEVLPSWSSQDRVVSATTRRPAQGRLFAPKQELALMPHLERLAAAYARSGSILILLRELVVPFGVIDLVGLSVRPSALQARLELNIPPILNEVDAGVISVLSAT